MSSGGGELSPGEQGAGVGLARRGDVRVADKIGAGDAVPGLDVREQREQGVDLDGREGFVSGVVQFNADRGGIHVRLPAPPGRPRVPGAQVFIHQLQHPAIAPDKIMAADLRKRAGQYAKRVFQRVVAGVMQNHIIGLPRLKIGRRSPLGGGAAQARRERDAGAQGEASQAKSQE
jgi:hypothetical protein